MKGKMGMMKVKFLFISLICIFVQMLFAGIPESGKPLLFGTSDNIGLFPIPSVNATPIGSVKLKGKAYPSLFLASDNWHPGIYRYDCIRLRDEVPVFGISQPVGMPERLGNRLPGSFVIYKENLYAFWLKGDTVFETIYDEKQNSFGISRNFVVASLPRRANTIQIDISNDDLVGYLGVGDGIPTNGPVHWVESKNFPPYGPDGIFVGNLSYSGLYGFKTSYKKLPDTVEAKQLTDLKQAMWGYQKFSLFKSNNVKGLMAGSHNGNFLFYRQTEDGFSLHPKLYAVDKNGIMVRHRTIWARPVIFSTDNISQDLIVSGEGGIYFYKFSYINEKGQPVYGNPSPLLSESPQLYGGSLVVPNLVDWDGDGDLDIIAGNSIGEILFFKNRGTDGEPAFDIPQYLEANGKKIHIQPGYKDDIQGPYESRWGYSSPMVFDWNQDGLFDIITNDSRGKHRLFLNIGTKDNPKLAEEAMLYVDGLELHGMWRTRPGVGKLGNDIVYITLDKDDQYHMYKQIDTYNLEDAGKLQLTDESYINGSFFPNSGGSGRQKLLVVDWDYDGVKDLIVGTPRHGSVPDKKTGMPYHYGDKGAAVLFLRNVGTEEKPVFDYPRMLKYKGETIHFGQHECAPTVGDLGKKNGLDLLVGVEIGRFIFFEREDLSW